MKLKSEKQVLDQTFRAMVIKEILGPENIERKKESLKRYEIYKDNAVKYVIEGLEKEGLKPETIEQMRNRASNISLCRKVVNKLARTYSGGVNRDAQSEGTNVQISELERLLSFNEKMKKGDRYRELQKNMMFQVVPESVTDPDLADTRYKLSMRTLLPWQYDVIEDFRDREVSRCIILSDFIDDNYTMTASTEHEAGIHYAKVGTFQSNSKDDIIADDPRDANRGEKRKFVWWTDNYHFTTDQSGKILDDPENPETENPIKMLPFANNSEEQDGQFWAVGGNDLIHGSILVNKQVTDMNFIAYLQGYGQWVLMGKNLNDRITMGPNNMILLEYDSDDPTPSAQVISANPPLSDWMAMIEQYVALLLTTNNLSPGNVAMKLDANNFPSGIAMMIEKSEATDDISDKQKAYQDIERKLWRIIAAWQNLYFGTKELTDSFMDIGKLPDDIEVGVSFMDIRPVISEKEKLETLKARKDLGLNTEIELIQRDNPDLSEKEAAEKLLKIKTEKLENVKAFQSNMPAPKEDESESEDDDDDDTGKQDIF